MKFCLRRMWMTPYIKSSVLVASTVIHFNPAISVMIHFGPFEDYQNQRHICTCFYKCLTKIKESRFIVSRGLPKAKVFWPSASSAEVLRPKLLVEDLGHIFGKIFRCNGQSVLITISFLPFFISGTKTNFIVL